MNLIEVLFFVVNVTVACNVGILALKRTHWSLGIIAGIVAFGGMIGFWVGLGNLAGWLHDRRKRMK